MRRLRIQEQSMIQPLSYQDPRPYFLSDHCRILRATNPTMTPMTTDNAIWKRHVSYIHLPIALPVPGSPRRKIARNRNGNPIPSLPPLMYDKMSSSPLTSYVHTQDSYLSAASALRIWDGTCFSANRPLTTELAKTWCYYKPYMLDLSLWMISSSPWLRLSTLLDQWVWRMLQSQENSATYWPC